MARLPVSRERLKPCTLTELRKSLQTTQTTVVTIATDQITDWESFHSVLQVAFGFPGFYGRNMNGWIDCMSDVDDPSSKMSEVSVAEGELLALRINDAADFERRCPEHYRRVDRGDTPALTLTPSGRFQIDSLARIG